MCAATRSLLSSLTQGALSITSFFLSLHQNRLSFAPRRIHAHDLVDVKQLELLRGCRGGLIRNVHRSDEAAI